MEDTWRITNSCLIELEHGCDRSGDERMSCSDMEKLINGSCYKRCKSCDCSREPRILHLFLVHFNRSSRVTRGINRINRRMLIWQFFLHTFSVDSRGKVSPRRLRFETNSRRAYQIGKHSGCCREWKIWGKAYVHSCINFSIILPGENIIRWIETTLLSFVSFFPQSLRG